MEEKEKQKQDSTQGGAISRALLFAWNKFLARTKVMEEEEEILEDIVRKKEEEIKMKKVKNFIDKNG